MDIRFNFLEFENNQLTNNFNERFNSEPISFSDYETRQWYKNEQCWNCAKPQVKAKRFSGVLKIIASWKGLFIRFFADSPKQQSTT